MRTKALPLSLEAPLAVIIGLEGDSSYIITSRAFNAAGSSEDTIETMTQEAGEII